MENTNTPTEEKQLSEGEYRVRTSFNVTGSSDIDAVKRKGAELINLIDALQPTREFNKRDGASFGRLKSLAMTEVEHGVSDAVKAITV